MNLSMQSASILAVIAAIGTGFTEPVYAEPRDTAFGYSPSRTKIDWVWENIEPAERLAALADAATTTFWYRQSPVPFAPEPAVPSAREASSFAGGPVEVWNPFQRTTGEMLVVLSQAGRLELFVRTPRRFYRGPVADEDPDWSLPFEQAGLNIDDFERVEPRYQPLPNSA